MIETTFIPWTSLSGGLPIGLAAPLLMATKGRIMGATGFPAGCVLPTARADCARRTALPAGRVSGPLAVLALSGQMPPADA